MVERKQKAKDKIIYSEQIIFLSTWDSLLIALLTYLEQLHYYAWNWIDSVLIPIFQMLIFLNYV